MTGRKLLVTTRSLIARINRKLKLDDERLRTTRGERMRQQVGDYFVMNYSKNYITDTNVDPETLGREIGALNQFEEVVEP